MTTNTPNENTSPFYTQNLNILRELSRDLSLVDLSLVTDKLSRLNTSDAQTLADMCDEKVFISSEWSLLAGRVLIRDIAERSPKTFSESIKLQGETGMLNDAFYKFVCDNAKVLDSFIVQDRDYIFNIFSAATLEKSYLMRIKRLQPNGKIKQVVVETPQYMFLRVATYLWFPNLERIRETYEALSLAQISHASPTLFNAGLKKSQLASCFLLNVEDNMGSITENWRQTALISAASGGIGINMTKLRHSEIGENGHSKGILPWLKVLNEILCTVDQCFGPDTIIYTNRGPLPISQLKKGDMVVTETGKAEKIGKVLKYKYTPGDTPNKTLYELDIKYYIEPVLVMGCHPCLSIKFPIGGTSANLLTKLKNKQIIPEYIDIQHLNKNYYVAFPIPTYVCDNDKYSLDDCYMYGVLVGDSHFEKNKDEVKVHLNDTTKLDVANFVKTYLEKKKIHYWEGRDKSEHGTYIGWTCNNKKFLFNRKMFYDENDEKIVLPEFLHLSLEKSLQVFKGIMETDGKRNAAQIVLEMTSRNVIESVRYILLRAGILTSGSVRDRRGETHELKRGGTITTKKISYVLIVPKTKLVCDTLKRTDVTRVIFFVYDNKIWSRIKYCEPYSGNKIPEYVYDLEIENPNKLEIKANYLTCAGAQHNGGRRKGSGTMYLRDFHVDIREFINARKHNMPENLKAEDLFYGIMISDLFMKRVKEDGMWSLFCPNKAKNLFDKWGVEFEILYTTYEKQGKAISQIKARDLWQQIILTEIETGMPFLLAIDAINAKSNQRNIGPILQSNLCVAPDTLILTKNGPERIDSLENKQVEIWNGFEWSRVKVVHTGANANLLKISFSNNTFLECTDYHNFCIRDGSPKAIRIPACELEKGMILDGWRLPDGSVIEQVYITKIEQGCRGVDTFCFTEPLRNKGMFNGIVSFQCTEIIEYTSEEELASCNLASICLNKCVKDGKFDFDELARLTKILVRNVNQMIDRTFYPPEIPQIKYANLKNRPMGIGVQGFSDVLKLLNQRFVDQIPLDEIPEKYRDNPKAKYVLNQDTKKLNINIFETMYYSAIEENIVLAQERGSYQTFAGSPISKGYLQPDLWYLEKLEKTDKEQADKFLQEHRQISRYSQEYVESLREKAKTGQSNSLNLTIMPTASSAHILGNTEAAEPETEFISTRTVLSGQKIILNVHMERDLRALDLWKTDVVKSIVKHGSLQALLTEADIPENKKMQVQDLLLKYLTAFELPHKPMVKLSADRGRYVCQTQSFNCFMDKPTFRELTAFFFDAWEEGLKTLMYYLRQKPKAKPINFAFDSLYIPSKKQMRQKVACNEEVCIVCST